MDVRILPTGPANLASIRAALHRLGATVELADKPQQVHTSRVLILPGVGTFGAARASLQASGLLAPLRERILAKRPTLAIALGLHLLAEGSDEAPGEAGLGVVEGRVARFPADVRTPHLGWNSVAQAGKGLISSGHAWYAHSYRLTCAPAGWRVCWSSHGRRGDPSARFVAALERGGQMAMQFHPELSGRWGETLLDRWLRLVLGGTLSMEPDTDEIGLATVLTRVVLCLDVADGRVVRGQNVPGLKDPGDPAELARAYDDRGADEIVLLDAGAAPQRERTIEAVRAVTSIPLTVGGGIESVEDAARAIDAGADRVVIDAARRLALVAEVATRFGGACTVGAIDARRNGDRWEGAGGIDAVARAADAAARGAGEILLTAVGEDGARAPYDLDLVRAVRPKVHVPLVASGRCSDAAELIAVVDAGAEGVLAAPSSERELGIGTIKEAMERHGLTVRR
jgi:imidazole glycerol phosphate synthase glutamine amidotransferase subunit